MNIFTFILFMYIFIDLILNILRIKYFYEKH